MDDLLLLAREIDYARESEEVIEERVLHHHCDCGCEDSALPEVCKKYWGWVRENVTPLMAISQDAPTIRKIA